MFDIVVFMRYKNSNVYLDGCLYFLVKDQQILTKVLSELLFLELHLYIYLFLDCYIFAFMVFNIHYLTKKFQRQLGMKHYSAHNDSLVYL